jgi:hypothetical protein
MTTVNDLLDSIMEGIKEYWMWMLGICAVLLLYGILLTINYFIKLAK